MKKIPVFTLAAGMALLMASGTAYAGGDAAKGKAAFESQCGYCHSIEPGSYKLGPPLRGVVGRKAGTGDFSDYFGLKDVDIVWTEENLDKYVSSPEKFLDGPVGMPISLKDPAVRADIIAYLKTLVDQ